MRKNNLKIFGVSFFCLSVLGLSLWVAPSHAFNLDRFLKDVEKSTQPQPKPKQEELDITVEEPKSPPPPEPQQSTGNDGMIGLGQSLGIFDKKTSKILKQSVNTLQALQPIAYKEEKAIGGRLAVEVFSRYGGAYNDPKLLHYINLVGQAVADVSTRPDIDYHFAILNTELPNAFATPGGYVFVSIGLLRMLENEAQLAGVLAHEVAHISQKHALQTLGRSRSLQGISALTLTAMDKNPGLFDKLIDEVSNVLFTKGLDKNLEFEADRYGREFAYRMGYYPGGLQNFIRKLGTSKAGGSSIFMSTHPSTGERYNRLKKTWSRYKKASLYPVLGKRFFSVFKKPGKS
ncbi:MAG: M48 family metalloprotease [Nitrospina sp.]|jgi:beta-barrel assembly-enhancing protease|nr:M48 family metalloprotease [Nitrospina sp.]MBT3414684.1 M48 family metalloprotease [Nitrospina sp.]MBT3856600.1 M48 family metalloprotease [Nitrospina sp.]MBT4105925.1 M48 family metalloprotease [Nitrospina sp.]MBT4390766.1 M48 family metalloprotease [Nitrospina sp.]